MEARYDTCAVAYQVIDGGTPEPCTEARGEQAEALADCIEPISCEALRGEENAPDRDAYFACLAES